MEDMDMTRREFLKLGLKDAWNRVAAYVVNTGADFNSFDVIPYDSDKFGQLKAFLATQPYVLEAHSTDYQNLESLVRMVRDGFAVLKVGPELTFRFREAIFAMCAIEKEMIEPQNTSHLMEAIFAEMKANPQYWEKHYQGSTIEFKFSLYDRIRYYWSNEKVKAELNNLFENLNKLRVPSSLLHQYAPDAVDRPSGVVVFDPHELIYAKVKSSLERYHRACEG